MGRHYHQCSVMHLAIEEMPSSMLGEDVRLINLQYGHLDHESIICMGIL